MLRTCRENLDSIVVYDSRKHVEQTWQNMMTQMSRGITWHPRHDLTSKSLYGLALTPCQQTRGFRVNWPCHRALPTVWHIVFVDIWGYMGSTNIMPRVHKYSSYVVICRLLIMTWRIREACWVSLRGHVYPKRVFRYYWRTIC